MSKQQKILLKSAKQFIQEKKYEEALQQCKNLLILDPKNYNGLVFSGLCYAELKKTENSKHAYHNAITLENNHGLAYQGLVNLYTKHWSSELSYENKNDLIEAYTKLIKILGSQDKKRAELQIGLAAAYCSNEKFLACLETVKLALQEVHQCGNGDITSDLSLFYEEVVRCLKVAVKDYCQLHEYSHLICETLRYFFKKRTSLDFEHLFKLFLLFHQADLKHINTDIITIVTTIQWAITSNWSSSFLAWCVIQVYWQDSHLVSEEVILDYINSLPSLDKYLLGAHSGFQAFKAKQYQSCVNSLLSAIDHYHDFLPLKLTLCKAYLYLHRWQDCEKLARTALQDCKRLQNVKLDIESDWVVRITPLSTLKLDFTLVFAKSLSESQSKEMLNLSIGTYEKLAKIWPESIDIYLGIAKAHLSLKNSEKAKATLDRIEKIDRENAEMQSWKAFICFEEGDRTFIDNLQAIADANPECFLAHFLLGKILFSGSTSQKRKAFPTFLKAAKLDVHHGPTFLYIGRYYKDVIKDSSKATRCFEKAFSLGPKNEETGSALADQYISEGNLAAAISLYENITRQAPTGECKWAWLRLGLCQLRNDQINSAIRSLLAAQRCDINDHVTWECLGEAYFHRGSFTSAWKSFNRAHELQPASVYSLYQMAAIKQILCRYPEAVAEYNDVLLLSPDYIPALKGLGESHLSLARVMLSEGRYMTCVDHVNESIKHLSVVISTRGDLSCVWKLLGDCMTIIHPLDGSKQSKVLIAVPRELRSDATSDCDVVTKTEALQLGGKFYVQALRMNNSPLLWHDLGLNYFYQAQEGGAERTDLAATAVQMLQKGLSLDEKNHVLWNSLGVLAASNFVKNFSLAQHCFIRSIECEPNNVEAWSNLGVFYLEQSQIELAHKAFKNAQSLSPAFANSWIGQALIAETINNEESMDLFRHATELSLHEEAGIGYAKWVANIVCEHHSNRHHLKYKENVHDLHALSAASVQMSKYCDLHPDCEWAFALYGFLLEETGLNRFAETEYKRSLDLLEKKSNEEKESSTMMRINEVKLDYARILFKNKKFPEAVDVYQSIASLSEYSSLCGFALSLLACGKTEDACAAFNQALLSTTSSDQQLLVHIALAVLSWKRGDVSNAIEQLTPYQGKSLKVVLCLCGLALSSNNDPLLQSLLAQLRSSDVIYRDDGDDITYDKTVVTTCVLARKNASFARRHVQKLIHKYPDDYRYRHLLSLLLSQSNLHRLSHLSSVQSLLNHHSDVRTLSTEAHINTVTPQQCMERRQVVDTRYALSCLSNGKHVDGRKAGEDCLKAAQRLAHHHPYSAESWSVLGGAAYAKTVLSRFHEPGLKLDSTSQKLLRFVTCQSESKLHAWAVKQKVLADLLDGCCDVTGLRKIDEDCEVRALLSIISARDQQAPLNHPPPQSSSYFSVMLHSHALYLRGELEEMFDYLHTASQSRDKQHASKFKLRSALLALRLSTSHPSKSNDWLKKAEKLLSEAGRDPLVQLAQGVVLMRMKSLKKSCSLLNKVLASPHVDPLCLSPSIAARCLYSIYHSKDDPTNMEKVVKQWRRFNDPSMDKLLASLSSK